MKTQNIMECNVFGFMDHWFLKKSLKFMKKKSHKEIGRATEKERKIDR